MTMMERRLDQLPADRRDRYLALLRPGRSGRPWERPIRPHTAGPLPLTAAQRDVLDAEARGHPPYLAVAFHVRGCLDPTTLRGALRDVAARHDQLRAYVVDGVSVVADDVEAPLHVDDVRGATRDGVLDRLSAFVARPFDPAVAPLWRVGVWSTADDDHILAVVGHGLVLDEPSVDLLIQDLAAGYSARLDGSGVIPGALPVRYADYAGWQHERMTSARRTRLLADWTGIAGSHGPDLPTDRPRTADATAGQVVAQISPDTAEAVRRLAANLGVTESDVYLASLGVQLHRYGREDWFTIVRGVDARDRADLARTVGRFTTFLPYGFDLDPQQPFAELVTAVAEAARVADAASGLGLIDMDITERTTVAFDHRSGGSRLELPNASVEPLASTPPSTAFDLHVRVADEPSGANVEIVYRTGLFSAATADRILAHYLRLTGSLAGAPQAPASAGDMMAAGERDELIHGWDGRTVSVPPATVHGWFEAQAARTPDAVAVRAGDVMTTFAELDRYANRIAHLLRAHSVDVGSLVGLLLPRGVDAVAATLAVLKVGAAFVPIDANNPPSRIAALLSDAQPRLLVTHSRLRSSASGASCAVLALDECAATIAAQPQTPLGPSATPTDLAYVIYTSGSTGTPKGVLIEHNAVVDFVVAIADLFGLTAQDRVLAYASCAFDVSIFEVFGALLSGASVCMALDADRLDIDRLQQLLERAEVTVADLPPSVMALLEPERMAKLRGLFIGGEAFSGELVNRWNPGRQFINGYGPTECTVNITVQECSGTWQSSPPIGLPMTNHVAHVVDEAFGLVPYGVPGELVIGGAGLARGYLNRPELTAERFVADPFGTAIGGRLYRTGDLVRRRRDGALVFLGRIDRQIKIRGVRIEPGEVETVLAGHPDVRQVLVDRWTDATGGPHLVAYVSLAPGATERPDNLRRFLAGLLPASMVPEYLVEVPELPLTTSGKVDRAALPDPMAAPEDVERVAPRTETERVLAEDLFGPVLGRTVVDVAVGFFDLGGGSLQAAQIVSGIRRRFAVEVGVADFFHDPTVVGLAALIDRQRATQLDDAELIELLDSMSEGEVERMLQIELRSA